MLSQQMTDEKFFEIMASVYNIKLDEADEWDFINAAREDRALVMNDRSQLDNLKADMNTAQERIAALKAENEQLSRALEIIGNAMNLIKYATEMGIDCSQHTNPATTMCAIANKARQPAKEQS